jgi:hypothetical protein
VKKFTPPEVVMNRIVKTFHDAAPSALLGARRDWNSERVPGCWTRVRSRSWSEQPLEVVGRLVSALHTVIVGPAVGIAECPAALVDEAHNPPVAFTNEHAVVSWLLTQVSCCFPATTAAGHEKCERTAWDQRYSMRWMAALALEQMALAPSCRLEPSPAARQLRPYPG